MERCAALNVAIRGRIKSSVMNQGGQQQKSGQQNQQPGQQGGGRGDDQKN